MLQTHELRSTPVRRGVLELISKRGEALASSEFEEATQADRITVYRTLRTFESSGLIHRVQDATGVDKYALCGGSCSAAGHHHTHAHFHCVSCEKTSCLKEVSIISQVLPKGYLINESHLTYTGICPSCN
ncbi:MAG: Fur family transcriptional regulator [Saprospiraceae bacterium]